MAAVSLRIRNGWRRLGRLGLFGRTSLIPQVRNETQIEPPLSKMTRLVDILIVPALAIPAAVLILIVIGYLTGVLE